MSKRSAAWAQSLLIGFICLWSAGLVLQNVAILIALKQGTPPYPPEMKVMFVVATVKAVAVPLAALYFLRQRSLHAAIIFGGVVLLTFPLGLFVDPTLRPTAHPSVLISLGALFSYATVAAIAGLHILRRRTPPAE